MRSQVWAVGLLLVASLGTSGAFFAASAHGSFATTPESARVAEVAGNGSLTEGVAPPAPAPPVPDPSGSPSERATVERAALPGARWFGNDANWLAMRAEGRSVHPSHLSPILSSPAIAQPLVGIAMGDAEGSVLAVSLTGNATSQGSVSLILVGAATGVAVAPLGNSRGTFAGASGTGAAMGFVAATLVGDATAGGAALAGVGSARGPVAVVGSGTAAATGVFVFVPVAPGVAFAGSGASSDGTLGATLLGTSAGTLAASGVGDSAGLVAVSGDGRAKGDLLSVTGLGEASGEVVGITLLGTTSGGEKGVQYRAWDVDQYRVAPDGDAEADTIAIAPMGNADARVLAVGGKDAHGMFALADDGAAEGEVFAASTERGAAARGWRPLDLASVAVAGHETSEGTIAFSREGQGQGLLVGASGTGEGAGIVGASGTGNGGQGEGIGMVGVSGGGDGSGDVAASGLGDARGTKASVSGKGDASGGLALCSGRMRDADRSPAVEAIRYLSGIEPRIISEEDAVNIAAYLALNGIATGFWTRDQMFTPCRSIVP